MRWKKRKEVKEMEAIKVIGIVGIGVVVLGVVGLVVVYPLLKTLEGWFEVAKAWALRREGPVGVELGLTLADGGEKAEERK